MARGRRDSEFVMFFSPSFFFFYFYFSFVGVLLGSRRIRDTA